MKITTKIFLLLLLIALITGFLYYDSGHGAVKRITVRTETLTSEKIPADLDGKTILFFSDTDYGTFVDEKRFTDLITKINNTGCDLVIFGGDLYDEAYRPNDASAAVLIEQLSRIKAPLGKFAVLGDFDLRDSVVRSQTEQILQKAQFEILNNASALIHNGRSDSISVVGLENLVNGKPDADAAYSSVPRTNYVIAVCHTPDEADLVPSDITSCFLAGHSHGGQVYYGFGAMYTPEKCTKYFRGKHSVSGLFTVDITNGTGTTGTDARFLSNAEIVLYTLKSTAKKETPAPTETPQITPAPDETPDAEQPAETPQTEPETPEESPDASENTEEPADQNEP